MNRSLPILAALVMCAIPAAGCSASFGSDDDGRPGIPATGTGGERHWAVSGFDAIEAESSGDVAVHVGSGYSVSATGDPAMLDAVKITRDGHALRIGWKRGVHVSHGGKLQFAVTMPRIAQASIGGAGSIAIDRADGADFQGDIGGSGTLAVRAMHVGKAGFSIGGSGNISAGGAAQTLSVSITGSGSVKALPLSAQTADISIAGSGSIAATVRQKADISIMGAGDVTIAGGAKCSVTKMGSGSVHCG